ncbi:MAG: hypothetical protein JWN70_6677 [Planctomycetaceae bacterium]|nr:hypothetical protein [Planctomycetaceae bacterium]
MFRQCLSAALLCTLLVGCGGSDTPPVAKVEGTVTYKAQPLATGTIVFYPVKGRSGSGEIKDGKIGPITTFVAGDGVPLGPNKVTIQAFDKPVVDMNTKRTSVIPTKYGDVNTSDLKADIKAGTNKVTFELKD